jgi:protein disulfide-isomerase A6
MEKVLKNPDFVGNEIARLNKVLEGGNITPEKRDSFMLRKNVLKVFEKYSDSGRGKEEL